jgi:alanine dehydrogenase
MPGAYARTATHALTNVTSGYIQEIADHGLDGALRQLPGLAAGVNVSEGRLHLKAVAEAHALPFAPLAR